MAFADKVLAEPVDSKLKLNPEKLTQALQRLGASVQGHTTESSVTIGEVDGVFYRLTAMDAETAEEEGAEAVPEWAACVELASKPNAGGPR